MAFKFNLKPFPLFFLLVPLTFATCKKDDCVEKSYEFKSSWKAAPEKDSVNVGDTITFLSTLNTLELNTNMNVVFASGVTINTAITVFVMRGNGILEPAVDSFKFLVKKGTLVTNNSTNPSAIKQLNYGFVNSKYEFEFQIVALKKGIYGLGFPNAILTRNTSKSCYDRGVVQLFNNNINNNLHYYKNLYYQGQPVPASDSIHGYSFKVR